MHNLQLHDITSIFVCIDDFVGEEVSPGRKPALAKSEMLSILLWGTLQLRAKTLKHIYTFILHHYMNLFPNLPRYQNFVNHCHRLIPELMQILQQSLDRSAPIRFVDSTMLPVCKLVRADRHKVAKDIAAFGKNHQGWHYGFKLHATINQNGQFCDFWFTPANVHDAQVLPKLTSENCKVLTGDSHYGASVMRERIWREKGIIIISPPHHTQKRKIATWWQNALLSLRSKIEASFGILKEQFSLVSSFPRSAKGYLFHYLRILLAYQFFTIS